jgi:hypothetical protein
MDKEEFDKELSTLLSKVSQVYSHITGGMFDNPIADATEVMHIADDYRNGAIRDELQRLRHLDKTDDKTRLLKRVKTFIESGQGHRGADDQIPTFLQALTNLLPEIEDALSLERT